VNFNSVNDIFSVDELSFTECCLDVFHFQYENNPVYRNWCELIGKKATEVREISSIPFLPISFFKTHQVQTGNFNPQLVFESSGTTQSVASKHFVKDTPVYEQSFLQGFRNFYREPSEYCILALLPSYLERGNSSLLYMVDKLIELSGHPQSGFYLYEHEQLHQTIQQLESSQQKVLLFGVTYALLDFAEAFPFPLEHTTIIETGGMKGRKKELTRTEVHSILQQQFQTANIHSEYGMTELLSQAYSKSDGIFKCPNWMKILVREEDDPLTVKNNGRGVINVIDLANIYSCSFIATDDAGSLCNDGSFEVLGRVDNSDIRGCSLLAL
jgi:phenylacetate-coenzyme A ligase PaaK-like adenylate-forming protein